jgi:hypothetical protein
VVENKSNRGRDLCDTLFEFLFIIVMNMKAVKKVEG